MCERPVIIVERFATGRDTNPPVRDSLCKANLARLICDRACKALDFVAWRGSRSCDTLKWKIAVLLAIRVFFVYIQRFWLGMFLYVHRVPRNCDFFIFGSNSIFNVPEISYQVELSFHRALPIHSHYLRLWSRRSSQRKMGALLRLITLQNPSSAREAALLETNIPFTILLPVTVRDHCGPVPWTEQKLR